MTIRKQTAILLLLFCKHKCLKWRLMIYHAYYAWLVHFDGPRCTNLKVLHYCIFFCLYMYTFVCCTLTASDTIVFSIFCESCFSLFSCFNKLVVSKARVGVHGLSVSSSHYHNYAPFDNNRTEVNQTLLTFYFWIPVRLIRTVGVYLLMILRGLSCIFSVSFSIHLVKTSCRKRACNLHVMSQVHII